MFYYKMIDLTPLQQRKTFLTPEFYLCLILNKLIEVEKIILTLKAPIPLKSKWKTSKVRLKMQKCHLP